jgi:hypothetical protein
MAKSANYCMLWLGQSFDGGTAVVQWPLWRHQAGVACRLHIILLIVLMYAQEIWSDLLLLLLLPAAAAAVLSCPWYRRPCCVHLLNFPAEVASRFELEQQLAGAAAAHSRWSHCGKLVHGR